MSQLAALRVSTCIIHVQLAESLPEAQCLISNKLEAIYTRVYCFEVINNFGWIHILDRDSQGSFGIVAGTCLCIKFVNAGDLE